jgi:hypothetical protein
METFDPKKRAAEKQASRDEDARRLAAGEVTQEELRRENSFIPLELIKRCRIVCNK